MKKISEYLLVSCLVLFCMSFSIKAQRTTSSLSGTVTDSSGAVIPGASIIVKEIHTGATNEAKSNGQGFYVISNLQPGSYKLHVKSPGFGDLERSGIEIQVGQSRSVDAVLAVGSAIQQVTVSAAPPLVNMTDQTVSIAVTPELTSLMPLNGRDVVALLAVAPDASSHSPNASAYSGQNVTRPEVSEAGFVTASGAARENSTTYYLDGGLNEDPYTDVANVFPNPDAVEEFTADTNSYSAKFGGRGGAVVNAITRGGTNNIHGTAWEYLRNGSVDGSNYFSTTPDTLKQNQFGFAVGGPLRRDKTFWFGSFQRTTKRYGSTSNIAYGPTAAELKGDWSALGSTFTNPLTGATFAKGQVSTSLYNPISLAFLKMIPSGDAITGKFNYLSHSLSNANQYVARADHHIGDKIVLSGSYLWDQLDEPNIADPNDVLTGGDNKLWTSQHASINLVYRFNNNLVTTVQATGSRVLFTAVGNAGFKTLADLGARYPNWSPAGSHEEGIYIGGGWGLQAYWLAMQRAPRNAEEILNNWTYVKGRHTLDFGAEIPVFQSLVQTANASTGYQGFWCANSGNSALDFMLGANCFYEQYSPSYVSPRGVGVNIYANDEWRISPRLTVNIGLRWEPWMPWADASSQKIGAQINLNAYANGVHSTRYPNLPAGFLVRGDAGVPNALTDTDMKLFDPRVGVAWNVFGDGKTSVRAGFGIYHDQFFARMYNQMMTSQPFNAGEIIENSNISAYDPYSAAPFNGTIPTLTFPQPSNTVFALPMSSVVGFVPDFKPPSTIQWNLTVEKQLAWGILLRTSYEASESYHMFDARDVNAATNYVRPMAKGNFSGNVIVDESTSTSSFNALVISAEKRMTGDLSFIGGYRWSKCLDRAGSTATFAFNEFTDAKKPYLDRGVCDSNLTNQFKMTSVWRTPTVAGLGFVGRQVLAGWTSSGTLTWYGGFPFSVWASGDSNRDGTVNDRANLSGNPYLSGSRSKAQKLAQWFNTTAFTDPVNSDGNTGRNILTGPGFVNMDFALIRSFKMPFGPFNDTQRIDFRTEAFNLFNHANFKNPDSNLGDGSSYGQISSALSPRIMQFALKYVF